MKDEIIQEIWRIKDELAREADYDVATLCRQLMDLQRSSHRKFVDRSKRVAPTAPRGQAKHEAGRTNP